MVRLPSGHIAVVPTQGASDDPLRHYVAIAIAGDRCFVGNGNHVEEVSSGTAEEADVFARFRTHSYEPDPPIHTPRILGVVDVNSGWLAIGSARRGTHTDCEHVWFETRKCAAGDALAVRTYQGDVQDPQSHGEPSWADAGDTIVDTAQRLWEHLDAELRVLVVASDVRTGAAVALDQTEPTRPRYLEP